MAKQRRPLSAPRPRRRTALPINDWLKFLGRSQVWLAGATGYSEPYISLLASGQKRFNQDNLEKISEAMGIEPARLLHKPTEEDFWAIWNSLDADQRRQAAAMLKAFRDAG